MDLVRPKVGMGESWSFRREWRRWQLQAWGSSAYTELCRLNPGEILSVHLEDGMMVPPTWGIVGARQCQES